MRLWGFSQTGTAAGRPKSDLHHLEIFFTGTTLRALPVQRHILPARTGRDILIGNALGLVIDVTADHTHVLLHVVSVLSEMGTWVPTQPGFCQMFGRDCPGPDKFRDSRPGAEPW